MDKGNMNIDLYNELTQAIDERCTVECLKEMVAIRSENPFDDEPREGYREKEMGLYFAEKMSAYGLEVELRDVCADRPNVFGYRKGNGDGLTLMLVGHLDTARTDGYQDAYDVREEEGNVYGRGACDMKAALAAYLEVARVLRETGMKLNGNLIVAGLIDEEYRMRGSRDVGRNGPHADQAIIGEPSSLAVCPVNKGRVSACIRTFGKSAHSSVPEQGENAIVRMARVIRAFSAYSEELRNAEPHPLCGHGRFNPGVIRGGTQVNMVPDSCELEVDRRTLPGETKERIYKEFRLCLDPLVQDDPGFRYEISDPTWLVPPNSISHNEPVVQSLLRAYEHVMIKTAHVTAFTGGSDAPYMGFSTVICGPGSIAQAHTSREFVPVRHLTMVIRMYLYTVLNLLA